MKAKIHVTLKQGILDPQGKAIEHALDGTSVLHPKTGAEDAMPGDRLLKGAGQPSGFEAGPHADGEAEPVVAVKGDGGPTCLTHVAPTILPSCPCPLASRSTSP